jgi:Flp pilus assembly protein TadD
VGWFWYLGTLVPVIGLVQVGLQSMADRFTYVPLIGVFIIVAWGSADLAARWPIARRALPVAGAAAVVAFAIAARVQLAYWQDSVTLWTRATEITLGVDTYQAHMSLGGVLRAEGRLAEADAHYAEASTLRPSSADARHQLGLVRGVQGRLSDAAVLLAEAARLAPADAQIRADLGFAYAGLGRSEEATAEYQASLRLNPDQARLHNNLGALLADRGRMREALVHFAEAVRLDPASDQWRVNLGQALARTGRAAEALVQFREALRLNPGHAVARRAVEALATTPAK